MYLLDFDLLEPKKYADRVLMLVRNNPDFKGAASKINVWNPYVYMTIQDRGHFQDTEDNSRLFASLDREKNFHAIPVIVRQSRKLYVLDSLLKISRGRVLSLSSAARTATRKLKRFIRNMLMQRYNEDYLVTT